MFVSDASNVSARLCLLLPARCERHVTQQMLFPKQLKEITGNALLFPHERVSVHLHCWAAGQHDPEPAPLGATLIQSGMINHSDELLYVVLFAGFYPAQISKEKTQGTNHCDPPEQRFPRSVVRLGRTAASH